MNFSKKHEIILKTIQGTVDIMLSEISQTEKNKYRMTYVESKKTEQTNQLNQTKNRLIDTENKLVVARVEGGWGRSEMGEGDQEIQTSRYKINKSWGCNVQHEE